MGALNGLSGLSGIGGITAPSAGYLQKILALGPILYYKMDETVGPTAIDQILSPLQDGTHVGVTLGQTGWDDLCPLYDGLNDYTNMYSVTFAGRFNGAAGTIAAAFKVYNAGVWTDGANRYAVLIQVNWNNYVLLQKNSTNGRFRFRYAAAGTVETIDKNGIGDVDWFHAAITWDKAAGVNGEVKAYWNGVQEGLTQVALGVWAGVPAITTTVIGAKTITPTNPWYGWIDEPIVWDRALTPAEVAIVATPGG